MTKNVIKNKIENKKVVALIIEANPITNGHIKIIKEAKKLGDILICLLAPDFVQRGELAIYNKYDRAKALIKHGADIVLEMPVEYALSSAKYYARASINILNKLGIVDYLIFGSNINDVEKLKEISDSINAVLNNTNKTIKKQKTNINTKTNSNNDKKLDSLKLNLNPKQKYIATSYPKFIEEKINLKLSPNDILGEEYLSAIKEFKSKIIPITIKRDESLKSASEIREILLNSDMKQSICRGEYLRKSHLDDANPTTLIDNIKYHTPLTTNVELTDHINQKIFYCIKNSIPLTDFYDIDEDFKNNILKVYEKGFTDYDNLCTKLHKKHLTLANVKRKLLHILLDIKESDVKSTNYGKNIKFIRVLAIKKESAKYLKHFSLPFITNTNSKEYNNFYKSYGFNIKENSSLKINYYSSLFYDLITNSKTLEGSYKFIII